MTIYRFGPFRLEKEQLLLFLGQTPLGLGPKVVETLLALVEHPGEVLGKSELLDRVWPEGFVEEANLAQNIYVIRKALREHWDVNAIETVPRRGYRFAAQATVEYSEHAHTVQAPPVMRKRPAYVAAAAALFAVAIATGIAQVAARSHQAASATQGLSASGARLYAMGKYYWNQRTADGVAKSIRYFSAVVASDPRDARGYAGLASAYAIDADYGYGPRSKQLAFARATQFAQRALRLDPNSAEAHAALGLVAVDQHAMARGVLEYRRAIALDPGYAPAHQWYGISLMLDGNTQAAFRELQKAADLDPESVAAADWLAQASFVSRRYKDAIWYGRQALDLSPQRYGVYQTVGLAYEELGNYRAAIAAYRTYGRTCQTCRYDAAALLAHLYAITHDGAQAQEQLQEAQRGIAFGQTDAENLVAALVAMGRKTDALRLLQKDKAAEYELIAVDPRMDPVRGDPRFRQYTQGPG